MSADSADWNSLPESVAIRLAEILKQENKWTRTGPQLRRVNASWKEAVDNVNYLVRSEQLRTSSLPEAAIQRILSQRKIKALHVTSREGHDANWPSLENLVGPNGFASLRELKLACVPNGNIVITELLPRATRLERLTLEHVTLSQDSFQALTTLGLLKNLRLHEIKNSEDGPINFQHLAEIRTLNSLAIEYCEGCTDLEFLKALLGLQSFTFATDASRVSNISCVSSLPSVTALSLMTNTVKEADLDDFVFPERLTALRIDRRFSDKLWMKPLYNLKTLAFQSKMTNKLVDLLGKCQSMFYPILLPWQRRSVRAVVWYRQRMNEDTSHVSPLYALDLSNMSIAPNIIGYLADYTKLRELRLHMTWIAKIHVENSVNEENRQLQFPSLQLLTVNPAALQISLLERMCMPKLKQIGIWFDAEKYELVVDTLKQFKQFTEVAFAVNGMIDDDCFWTDLCQVLKANEHLRRIGWKDYKSGEPNAPDTLLRHFETYKRVLIDVDTDTAIFRSRGDA